MSWPADLLGVGAAGLRTPPRPDSAARTRWGRHRNRHHEDLTRRGNRAQDFPVVVRSTADGQAPLGLRRSQRQEEANGPHK